MRNAVLILLLIFVSCDEGVELPDLNIAKTKYYNSEIIPAKYSAFYGQWKLTSVSGGFSGQGFAPNFDFLEIRSFGVYGIMRHDTIAEYGKIEVDTFDIKSNLLQVKFIPDSSQASSLLATFSNRYVELEKGNKLNLLSGCCDAFDHHFERVK